MENTRTKIDALKDLGDKVTGQSIVMDENETIVGMIDKITANYEGGGSGGGSNIPKFILQGQIDWILAGEYVEITDEYNIAQFMGYKDVIASGGSAKFGFKLTSTQYEDPVYYVLQTKIDYLPSIPSVEGEMLNVEGIGFLNVVGMPDTFVKVNFNYGWRLHSTTERIWTIKLTPLTQS